MYIVVVVVGQIVKSEKRHHLNFAIVRMNDSTTKAPSFFFLSSEDKATLEETYDVWYKRYRSKANKHTHREIK